MKRAVNNVPLNTVLGLMSGFTKVVIEDRKLSRIYYDNAKDTEIWQGLVKEFWYASDTIRYKWGMTKVHEIRHLQDGIMIIISTEFEEY